MELDSVEVEASGHFGSDGAPGQDIRYAASVSGKAPEAEIEALMRHTDSVAEIQNTLRHSSDVVLTECKARDSRV